MLIFVLRISLMKTILSVCFMILATAAFSQNGLVKEYDASCNCTHYTNHFDNGVISATYSEDDNGKRDGDEKSYYPSGQLQYERLWVNGKMNGDANHYHRNGNLHYTESYNMGAKAGKWSFFDTDGSLVQSITYNGNNSDGVYDYYNAGVHYFSQTMENGKVTEEHVIDQQIYDTLKAEAEAAREAGK